MVNCAGQRWHVRYEYGLLNLDTSKAFFLLNVLELTLLSLSTATSSCAPVSAVFQNVKEQPGTCKIPWTAPFALALAEDSPDSQPSTEIVPRVTYSELSGIWA